MRTGHRRKGSTRSEGRKENVPLVDRVAIVVEVYGEVCQLYLRLWKTTLATYKLCGNKAYIDMYYYCTL